MQTVLFKTMPGVGPFLQTCLKQRTPNIRGSYAFSLKPLPRSLRLAALHSRGGLVLLSAVFLAAHTIPLLAQNIPPMIGDHVGKPRLRIPNPLESAQKDSSKTSEGAQSGQASSLAGEREVRGFLENWRSALSNKDMEALSSCYLQTESLRVYWDSQEFSGCEPFKVEVLRRFTSPAGFQLELREPHLKVFGRFAWVTTHYSQPTWTEAAPKSQEGLMTLVLEKRRSVWTILHQHASIAAVTSPGGFSTK